MLSRVLRDARERAGLSQRGLALRMGVSWVTVSQVERGAEPRHSTLVRYLRALPDLAPQEILSSAEARGVADADATWEHYRALFGYEAEEVRKRSRIAPCGDCETVIETRGLRSLRGSLRDLRILVGLQRAVFQGSPSVLRSIEARHADLTARVVERRDGRAVHQFRFPETRARGGITYRRRHLTPTLYKMTDEAAAEAYGRTGPFVEGTTLAVAHPVHRLRLEVCFPDGYQPVDVAGFVWPAIEVPDPDLPDLSTTLHPGGLPVVSSRSGRTVALEVERPLVGLKYGLGWELP